MRQISIKGNWNIIVIAIRTKYTCQRSMFARGDGSPDAIISSQILSTSLSPRVFERNSHKGCQPSVTLNLRNPMCRLRSQFSASVFHWWYRSASSDRSNSCVSTFIVILNASHAHFSIRWRPCIIGIQVHGSFPKSFSFCPPKVSMFGLKWK